MTLYILNLTFPQFSLSPSCLDVSNSQVEIIMCHLDQVFHGKKDGPVISSDFLVKSRIQ